MKKILTAALAALILAGCASDKAGNGEPTIFQGRFIGYTDEYVEFFDLVDGEYIEIPVKVNPDGTFCDTLQFDGNKYNAALFADKFMFRVCIEQGKTYTAEFDLTEEGVETNFKFIGEGEAENRFLSHMTATDPFDHFDSVKNFKDCREMLESLYSPLLAELKTIGNKPFVKFHEAQIKNNMNLYSCFSQFFAAAANGSYQDDPEFNSFIAKNYKLADDEFEGTMNNVFTNIAYMVPDIDATSALQAAAACATKPGQKETAMNMMLQALASAGNFNGIAEAYEFFQDNVTNDDYLDAADELCRNALTLAPGIQAPEIEFKDIDGKVFHLADFAGKPLYIDLWASWCGPCCEEIPHMAKFVESLGNDPGIVCISISIDDEESDWTTKLEEVGSAWPQYIATAEGQASISGTYFISAIPRFLLIDAEGKIASVNAPRPSDSDLLSKLKELLCAE